MPREARAFYGVKVFPNDTRPLFLTRELQATIMSLTRAGVGAGKVRDILWDRHVDRYLEVASKWCLHKADMMAATNTIFRGQDFKLEFSTFADPEGYAGTAPLTEPTIAKVYVESLEASLSTAQRFMAFPYDDSGVISSDATFRAANAVAIPATADFPMKHEGTSHVSFVVDAIGCVKSFLVGSHEQASRGTFHRQLAQLKKVYDDNKKSISAVGVGTYCVIGVTILFAC